MRDDRRGHGLHRLGKAERPHRVVDQRGDRLHALQRLDARLRLPRLRGLGAEAVDEGLHVLARGFLLDAALLLQLALLGALALELVVAAAPEGQLLLVEMDDRVDGAVEQVAVVADQQHGVRIARDVVLQPQRAFEVEIVGRLVEQQKVGLGKQHRGQRHAHAPAAGEGRGRPLLRVGVEAEAGEDGGGARFGRMRVDVGKPHVDLGDAVRVGRGLLFGRAARRARCRP